MPCESLPPKKRVCCRASLTLSIGSHPFVTASLVLSALLFPLFLYAEARAVKPIMPLYLIRHAPHMNLIFSHQIAAFLSNAIIFNM